MTNCSVFKLASPFPQSQQTSGTELGPPWDMVPLRHMEYFPPCWSPQLEERFGCSRVRFLNALTPSLRVTVGKRVLFPALAYGEFSSYAFIWEGEKIVTIQDAKRGNPVYLRQTVTFSSGETTTYVLCSRQKKREIIKISHDLHAPIPWEISCVRISHFASRWAHPLAVRWGETTQYPSIIQWGETSRYRCLQPGRYKTDITGVCGSYEAQEGWNGPMVHAQIPCLPRVSRDFNIAPHKAYHIFLLNPCDQTENPLILVDEN